MNKIILFMLIILYQEAVSDWQPINNGLYGGGAYQLTAAGNDIYLNTFNFGVYLSTDFGESWTPKNKGLTSKAIKSLAAINGAVIAGTYQNGVFVSTDKGENWVLKSSILDNLDIFTLVTDKGKVYAGTSQGIYVSNDIGISWTLLFGMPQIRVNAILIQDDDIYSGTMQGVYLSTDNGENWNIRNEGLNCKDVMAMEKIGENILVSVYNVSTDSIGIYLSANKSENWSLKLKGNIYDIETAGELIFASTSNSGVYISTDKGENWQKKSSGIKKNATVRGLLYTNNRFFAASNGVGVYLSTDFGETWGVKNKGIANPSVNTIIKKDNNLFAGLNGIGLFKSTDNGADWHLVNKTESDMVYTLFTKENLIFSGTYGNGILVSTDDGNSWTEKNFGLYSNGIVNCFLEKDNNIFVGTNVGVYFTSDNGENWTAKNNGLKTPDGNCLALSGNDIFVGNYDGVYISTDYGDNWIQKRDKKEINALAIINDYIYAAPYGEGIVFSTDNGDSWVEKNKGLVTKRIYSLESRDNYLFASGRSNSYGKVLFSTDRGDNWAISSSGLPSDASIINIKIIDNYLYACTSGYGIYRAPLSDFGITSVSDEEVNQNYLYAFKPYPIPAAQQVSALVYWDTSLEIENDEIFVYDIYGQKIAGKESITINKLAPYKGNITWNCSAAANGIYFIQINHGTITQTVKVMVNR